MFLLKFLNDPAVVPSIVIATLLASAKVFGRPSRSPSTIPCECGSTRVTSEKDTVLEPSILNGVRGTKVIRTFHCVRNPNTCPSVQKVDFEQASAPIYKDREVQGLFIPRPVRHEKGAYD